MIIGHQRPGEYALPVLIKEHGIAGDIKLVVPIGKPIRQHRDENNTSQDADAKCPQHRLTWPPLTFSLGGFFRLMGGGFFRLVLAHIDKSECTKTTSIQFVRIRVIRGEPRKYFSQP